LVYFSGKDQTTGKWEVYSFEFYYENLNQLTNFKTNCHNPIVSPDEDHVLFVNTSRNYPFNQLYGMNWYGEEEQKLADFHIMDPSFDNSGLKVFFISKKDGRTGDLYSIWLDGSHLERLTNTDYRLRTPKISPDGRFMAISVKLEGGFDIFLIPFEDY
jgi:Tol biopolymer transport system component